MIRGRWAREAVGVAWRALLVLFVLTYLGRSLAILTALLAIAGTAVAVLVALGRVLLLRRRGW